MIIIIKCQRNTSRMIISWPGLMASSQLIDSAISSSTTKFKSAQLITCLETKVFSIMDWFWSSSDSFLLIHNHQPQLLILIAPSMEFRPTKMVFSSTKVNKLTGLSSGDTQISFPLVSCHAGFSSQVPTISSCLPLFHWPSSQEDGLSRDISLGTQSSCLTLSKSSSTSHSSLDRSQSTSSTSKISRRFQLRPSRTNSCGQETSSTRTWFSATWNPKRFSCSTSRAYGTRRLSSTHSCIEMHENFI